MTDDQENIKLASKFAHQDNFEHIGRVREMKLSDSCVGQLQVFFFIVIQHIIAIDVIIMICDGFRAYGQTVYQNTEIFPKAVIASRHC